MEFYEENIAADDLKKYTEVLQSESFLGFIQMLFFSVKNNYHQSTPMLFIAGEKDNIFSVKEEKRTATHYNADFKLIRNAPHNLMLSSQWKEVANEIESWLSQKVFKL